MQLSGNEEAIHAAQLLDAATILSRSKNRGDAGVQSLQSTLSTFLDK